MADGHAQSLPRSGSASWALVRSKGLPPQAGLIAALLRRRPHATPTLDNDYPDDDARAPASDASDTASRRPGRVSLSKSNADMGMGSTKLGSHQSSHAQQVQQVLRAAAMSFLDADVKGEGDGELTLDEFVNILPAELRASTGDEALHEAFSMADADGSGSISRTEVRATPSSSGPQHSRPLLLTSRVRSRWSSVLLLDTQRGHAPRRDGGRRR